MLAAQNHNEMNLGAGKPRVALVTNVIAHYRVPCFQKLQEMLPGRVGIFFTAPRMDHRSYVLAPSPGQLGAMPLNGWSWRRPPHDDFHLSDPRPVLRGNYDTIILGGWDEPIYLLLWLWGVIRRRRIFFWVESTAKDSLRRGTKEKYKRALLARAAGCIVPGKRSFEYCRQLGVPAERIFTAPNATDRSYFREKAERLLPRRAGLRREKGLEGLVVLFVGRLVESLKGVSTLIKAADLLQKAGEKVALLIVGDGPDRKSYEDQIRTGGIREVRFLGLLDHEKLCRYYAMADLLVQPSRSEPWGFVLNEGMEFGLPLVVSEAVGAGPDLVKEGENGFVFPVGDSQELARVLQKFIKKEGFREKLGATSRSLVEHFSPDHWAEGVIKAIRSVTLGA
jgi:glycosyltransferase involved in cell wall biosynthesis